MLFRLVRTLFQKGINFLKSPTFKRLIVKFLSVGSGLPVALRLLVRIFIGILLMIGGVLWFLPVLGLWMFPLGVLLIGTCIPYFDRKIGKWMVKLEIEIQAAEANAAALSSINQESKSEFQSRKSESS